MPKKNRFFVIFGSRREALRSFLTNISSKKKAWNNTVSEKTPWTPSSSGEEIYPTTCERFFSPKHNILKLQVQQPKEPVSSHIFSSAVFYGSFKIAFICLKHSTKISIQTHQKYIKIRCQYNLFFSIFSGFYSPVFNSQNAKITLNVRVLCFLSFFFGNVGAATNRLEF